MAYAISYTDSVNKGTITVSDSTLNTETSLSLPGRYTTAYGQAISENFLHLLENFASSTAPQRPVEGQLWYDTASGVDQLKLYDGTIWQAAAGLKKATSEPAVANSSAGDLWVNTGAQQLYLFTGSTWILVGPEFTDGLLTGTKSDVLVGTDNLSYSVLSIKVKDKTAFIISDRAFTPKTAIAGFTTGIKAGMNVTSVALFGIETLKYYGTAEKADALVVGSATVPAANFVRTDQTSISNFDLKIKNTSSTKLYIKNIFLNLIGKHNVHNATAAIALCLNLGLKESIIKKALKNFSGVQRRLTKVFKKNKIEFYDDYAHHPTEIRSVLEGVRLVVKKRKIISIFQPHRYSRIKSLKTEFASCFKNSDQVLLCPMYGAGELIDSSYNKKNFAKLISKFSKTQVILIENENDLTKYFRKNLIKDEIVIGMGAGSISKWMYNLKNIL